MCLLIGCLFVFHWAFSNEDRRVLIVENDNQEYNPASFAYFLIPAKERIDIEEFNGKESLDSFSPILENTPNFGLTDTNVWLRFDIQNQAQKSPYLVIDNAAIDTAEYFLVDANQEIIQHSLTGGLVSSHERNVASRELMINLNIPDNQRYTCYLKLNAQTTNLQLPMTIGSIESLFQTRQKRTLWHGLYFGLVLFLFIYNCFLFASLKDLTYLYFAAFIASIGLLFSIFTGFGNYYLWESYPEINNLMPTIGALCGIFMILFSSKFLQSKQKAPRLHKVLFVIIGIFSISIIANVIGYTYLSTQVMTFTSVFGLIFLMFLAIRAWKAGYKPAKFYLFAWSFYVIGIVTNIMRDFALVEINSVTGSILQITSTISIIFMSFALSKKINIYIEKRRDSHRLAVQTSKENKQLVDNHNILLESKVHQRTIDLEQTISTLSKQREELEEAGIFKDKVLSIVSHDLKSPIATLAGMLQAMKLQSLSELERATVIESLEVALQNTKILLENILTWAQNKNGALDEKNDLNVHNCVKEIFELFHYQATDKKIALQNDIASDLDIHVNQNMLQLVLRNLVSNAIKFTPETGSVQVAVEVHGNQVMIMVRDTGIGMDDAQLKKVLDSNQHASTPGTANEKGTGLGLKLCKEFINKYQGKLRIESSPGDGTSIFVYLPKAIPVMEEVIA